VCQTQFDLTGLVSMSMPRAVAARRDDVHRGSKGILKFGMRILSEYVTC
jgi:hypothetical protein